MGGVVIPDLKNPNISGTETLWLVKCSAHGRFGIKRSHNSPAPEPERMPQCEIFIRARLWYDACMMARTYLARFEYFDQVVVREWDRALPVRGYIMVTATGAMELV